MLVLDGGEQQLNNTSIRYSPDGSYAGCVATVLEALPKSSPIGDSQDVPGPVRVCRFFFRSSWLGFNYTSASQ